MMYSRPASTIGLLPSGRDKQTLTHYGIILWILVAYLNPKYQIIDTDFDTNRMLL